MFSSLRAHLASQLETIRAEGLWKGERLLASPQGARIAVQGREVLNLCANNYLGLANHPEIVAAAKAGLDRWGYGLSSVRFICGTQEIHKELERTLSEFLGTEDTILYSSCFDANGGFFEALLSEQDAIVSDELNHASIIDGVRLCRAQRFRYRNGDLADLEARLSEARGARFRVIATDGVFSMDGAMAPLAGICALAERYEALVLVDDSHATGFVGPGGRGTHEQAGVMGRVDVLTGTLGKALGGASGGYVSGRREIVEFLRQRSRPYLFSNTVPPAVAAGALKAIELVEREPAHGGVAPREEPLGGGYLLVDLGHRAVGLLDRLREPVGQTQSGTAGHHGAAEFRDLLVDERLPEALCEADLRPDGARRSGTASPRRGLPSPVPPVVAGAQRRHRGRARLG